MTTLEPECDQTCKGTIRRFVSRNQVSQGSDFSLGGIRGERNFHVPGAITDLPVNFRQLIESQYPRSFDSISPRGPPNRTTLSASIRKLHRSSNLLRAMMMNLHRDSRRTTGHYLRLLIDTSGRSKCRPIVIGGVHSRYRKVLLQRFQLP